MLSVCIVDIESEILLVNAPSGMDAIRVDVGSTLHFTLGRVGSGLLGPDLE
jgi:hypothetical protein